MPLKVKKNWHRGIRNRLLSHRRHCSWDSVSLQVFPINDPR